MIFLKPEIKSSMIRRKSLMSLHQKEYLNHQFKCNPRPTIQDKQRFAAELNIPYKSIQNWFQNTRAQLRKHFTLDALMVYSLSNLKAINPFCNALCIPPVPSLVEYYVELTNRKRDFNIASLKLRSHYNFRKDLYSVGYW